MMIKLILISSGAYRTALCAGCNLNRKNQLFIPIFCPGVNICPKKSENNLSNNLGYFKTAKSSETVCSVSLGSEKCLALKI